MLKSNIIKIPASEEAVILTKLVTSLLLFRLIQVSGINTIHIINQSRRCTFIKF